MRKTARTGRFALHVAMDLTSFSTEVQIPMPGRGRPCTLSLMGAKAVTQLLLGRGRT
jgi:hypothetical protein